MKNKSILLTFFAAFVLYFRGSSQIFINELQLTNKTTIADEAGLYFPWVELYNAGNAKISIKNFSLTDDSTAKTKWKFPDVYINAKGTILIYLSGKNAVNNNRIHSNFVLKNGESLFLYNTSGKQLDKKIPVYNERTMSQARIPNGSTWCITSGCTPDSSNNSKTCYSGFLEPPVFAVGSGLVKSGTNVKLSTTQANCIIRYTLNGNIPNENSPLYKTYIKIDADKVIRAACFDTTKTYFTSRTVTNTYITNNKTFKLPIVCLTGDSTDLFDANTGLYPNYGTVGPEKRDAHIEYMLPSGKLQFELDADLSIHGNGSRSMAKKSLRVETNNKYDSSSINYKLFPFRSYTDITAFTLRSGSQDQGSSMMRDELCARMMLGTNIETGEHQSCVVFINGMFWGIYHIREKEDNEYLQKVTGVDKDSVDIINLSGQALYGTTTAYYKLINLYSDSLPTQAKYDTLSKYLDIKSWCDYITIESFIHNNDWPGNNTKQWAPHLSTGGKFRYMLYDTDYGMSDTADKIGKLLSSNYFGIQAFTKNSKFKNDFINRYADLLNTTLSVANWKANITYIKNNISYDMDKEKNRWGGTTSYWDQSVAYLQDFVTMRITTARNHLVLDYKLTKLVNLTLNIYPSGAGVVKLNTIIPSTYPWKGVYFDGVPVTVTAVPSPGYTFDSMVVNITSTYKSKTVTKNLTSATSSINFYFKGNSRNLKIAVSEVNYDCHSTINSGNWIELHNYDTVQVDMTGYKLKTSKDYGFYEFKDNYILPAGGYIVVCEDTLLFKKVYPAVTKRLGNIVRGLGNKGDSIILIDNKGKRKILFTYTDSLPWPENVGGTGRTMELVNDTLKPASGTSWFNGCIGGSPGRSYFPCIENIIITEISYNSKSSHDDGEWIELYNTSSGNITLGGWHFKDGDDTHDYIIPTGTILKSHEYLVLCNDLTKFKIEHAGVTNISGPFNFGLSNSGELLRLFDSKLNPKFSMGYHNESLGWPAKPNGEGYTLELARRNSDYSNKINWITGCQYGSPGKDREICPEDVVLVPTEINYKPLQEINSGDWIEFKNTSKDTINTYKWNLLANSSNYILPNIEILPKNYIIIAEDTAKLYNAFPTIDKNKVYQLNLLLNDTTETITLFDSSNIKRFEMFFVADSNDQIANGNGYTLQLQQIPNNYSEYSIHSNWRHGCFLGNPLEFINSCSELISVSEINFNGDSLKKTADWLELYNYGNRPINLNGYNITTQTSSDIWKDNMILYPKTRLLISADSNNIKTNYNLGSQQMNLNLGQNDDIHIYNYDHKSIARANYDTSTLLYANGLGKTMESIIDTNYITSQNLWMAGCFGGSPAAAYSPCPKLDVVVSEINYLPLANFNTGKWFELLNQDSTHLKNISNYYISFGDVKNIVQLDSNTSLPLQAKTVFLNDTAAFKFYFPFAMSTKYIDKDLIREGWVRIWDENKNPVFVMKYDNSFGGKGNGKTISLIKPDYNLNYFSNKLNWEEGCIGGSPSNYRGWCDTTLLVSEINYQSSSKNDAGDWLELSNKTSNDINLKDIYVYDSKDKYYILKGNLMKDSLLVLVGDSAKFLNENPKCKSKQHLSNLQLEEKGSIRIFGADKSMIYLSSWDYAAPWNDSADGKGYTLEYNTQYSDFSDAGTWFIGCLGGSPGKPFAADCYITLPDTSKNSIHNSEINTDIYIAPNPTTGLLTIYFGASYSNSALMIYDAKGVLVHSSKNSAAPQQTIDLSNFESGLYFLIVNQNKRVKMLKFVKE